jgi:TolB protein
MELFVATSDLQNRRQLTYNDVDESHPMLSKDKSQILFTEGSPETQRTKVVIMNLDGSGRRTLTSEPHVFGAIPSFSRSNLHVAYAEWTHDAVSGTLSMPRIVLLDVVSGARRYITPADRESWRPVFAPDDRRLYYISKVGDQFELYSYELSSGTGRRLTQTPFDEWDPQVSPSGQHVVYAAKESGNWDLFLMDVAIGQTRRLTRTKGDEWDPSIAPDGRTILFAGRFGVLETIFAMPLRTEGR